MVSTGVRYSPAESLGGHRGLATSIVAWCRWCLLSLIAAIIQGPQEANPRWGPRTTIHTTQWNSRELKTLGTAIDAHRAFRLTTWTLGFQVLLGDVMSKSKANTRFTRTILC